MSSKEQELITAIWTSHENTVRRWLSRRLNLPLDNHDIAEALAATAETLTRHVTEGKTITSPRAWLTTVAWREYLKSRRPYEREIWTEHDIDPAFGSDGDEVPNSIAQKASDDTLDRTLERALSNLTPHQRQILLAFYDGASWDEIAERFNISYGSVSKALTRARAKLSRDDQLRQAFRQWTE